MWKMQDFIVEGKDIFIGLEDSKRNWRLAVRCERQLIRETSMPAEYPQLNGYLRNNYPNCKVHLVYEAGFHGFWLHDLLVRDNGHCIVVPPHTVTDERTRRVKTDKIDARRLALNLENGDVKRCVVPDEQRREDRQLSRTLEDVQNNVVRARNQIWKMLDFHGIKPPISKQRPGKDDIRALRKLDLDVSLKQSLDAYIDQLELYWKQLKSLRDDLRKPTKDDRYSGTFKIIHSAPGIGWFTAIRLVLEWGSDLSRFADKRKIAGFIGLTGREWSTGETVRRGGLTGLGHRRSRTWLVESAWVAIRNDAVLLDKYKRVLSATGCKNKAVVAVARKLAGRILHCVKTGQPYVTGLIEELKPSPAQSPST